MMKVDLGIHNDHIVGFKSVKSVPLYCNTDVFILNSEGERGDEFEQYILNVSKECITHSSPLFPSEFNIYTSVMSVKSLPFYRYIDAFSQ